MPFSMTRRISRSSSESPGTTGVCACRIWDWSHDTLSSNRAAIVIVVFFIGVFFVGCLSFAGRFTEPSEHPVIVSGRNLLLLIRVLQIFCQLQVEQTLKTTKGPVGAFLP